MALRNPELNYSAEFGVRAGLANMAHDFQILSFDFEPDDAPISNAVQSCGCQDIALGKTQLLGASEQAVHNSIDSYLVNLALDSVPRRKMSKMMKQFYSLDMVPIVDTSLLLPSIEICLVRLACGLRFD